MNEEDYDIKNCPICGSELRPEMCWQCHGDGGFHDCGEDCCACADPDEITDICEECRGEGLYLVCCSLPHTDEQMAAYKKLFDQI